MQCTESLVSLKISVTFSIGAPLSGECELNYDLLCIGYFHSIVLNTPNPELLANLTTPTLDTVMYLFCKMARSGISMQVSTVSSQDRFNITESIRQVLNVLRTSALAFSATVRPILSTSECSREERLPEQWKKEKMKLYHVN